jgi:hypothetical protein
MVHGKLFFAAFLFKAEQKPFPGRIIVFDFEIHDGADPGESVGKDSEQSASASSAPGRRGNSSSEGPEWILAPKSELSALLAGKRRLPVKGTLSDEHKAVLLVVSGHRRKGGVSKARVEEILGLDASSYLNDLLSQELIYSDPSRELNFWRPTQSALLALGFRSFGDIPALKELEEWFEAQRKEEKIPRAKLDRFFDRTQKLASRRLKRELERRETVISS